MKKAILFLLPIILVFSCFFGCSSVPKIEDYEWVLHTVTVIQDSQAVVIAGKEEYLSIFADASFADMTLAAKDGALTLTDHANNKSYIGTYTRTEKTPRSSDYSLTIGNESGFATVAMTTDQDGSQTPTLPVSLGNYTLQFYAKES